MDSAVSREPSLVLLLEYQEIYTSDTGFCSWSSTLLVEKAKGNRNADNTESKEEESIFFSSLSFFTEEVITANVNNLVI